MKNKLSLHEKIYCGVNTRGMRFTGWIAQGYVNDALRGIYPMSQEEVYKFRSTILAISHFAFSGRNLKLAEFFRISSLKKSLEFIELAIENNIMLPICEYNTNNKINKLLKQFNKK